MGNEAGREGDGKGREVKGSGRGGLWLCMRMRMRDAYDAQLRTQVICVAWQGSWVVLCCTVALLGVVQSSVALAQLKPASATCTCLAEDLDGIKTRAVAVDGSGSGNQQSTINSQRSS